MNVSPVRVSPFLGMTLSPTQWDFRQLLGPPAWGIAEPGSCEGCRSGRAL